MSATNHALAIATAVITMTVTAFYWYVISGQGDQSDLRPQLLASSSIVVALAVVGSLAVRRHSWRLLLLSSASSTLLVWATLGALSIGVLLLPAVFLSLIAASRESASVASASARVGGDRRAAGSVLLAVIVLGSS